MALKFLVFYKYLYKLNKGYLYPNFDVNILVIEPPKMTFQNSKSIIIIEFKTALYYTFLVKRIYLIF